MRGCHQQIADCAKRILRYDAVIVDDIGYVQQSRQEVEVLFAFLADRYERGSVMITSNLPFYKWEQIFKDPMTAAAAIDRPVHHRVILQLNIESYRMEVAKKKYEQKNVLPARARYIIRILSAPRNNVGTIQRVSCHPGTPRMLEY